MMRPVHSALGLVAAQGLRCLSRVGILRIHATQGRIGRLQMLPVGAGLPAMAASQPMPIHLTPHNPNVGAGLPAMTA